MEKCREVYREIKRICRGRNIDNLELPMQPSAGAVRVPAFAQRVCINGCEKSEVSKKLAGGLGGGCSAPPPHGVRID